MKPFVATVLLVFAGAPALAQPTIIPPPGGLPQPAALASRCVVGPGRGGSDLECTIEHAGVAMPAMRILIRTQAATTPCRVPGAREVPMAGVTRGAARRGALPIVIHESRERRCAA